jgi:hypothetical protein
VSSKALVMPELAPTPVSSEVLVPPELKPEAIVAPETPVSLHPLWSRPLIRLCPISSLRPTPPLRSSTSTSVVIPRKRRHSPWLNPFR